MTDIQHAVKIEQWQSYEGDDWWKWAVWVEAQDDVLDRFDKVVWILHPSFPEPIREIRDRATKFRLETAGWGVFTIVARVQEKNGAEIKLRHHLELHYPDGTPTQA